LHTYVLSARTHILKRPRQQVCVSAGQALTLLLLVNICVTFPDVWKETL